MVVVVVVVLVVVVVAVPPMLVDAVEGRPCRFITSPPLSLPASRMLSLLSVGPGNTGGDEYSMLGGRGLGWAFSDLGGDATLLRGESCLASCRAEDGDVGGEDGCSSPLFPDLASCVGAAGDVMVFFTSCFSFPLLSVRVCFDVRGVVLSGEWGPVLAGFALLQSSLGTLVGLPGAMRDGASAGPDGGIVALPWTWEGLEIVFSAPCAL